MSLDETVKNLETMRLFLKQSSITTVQRDRYEEMYKSLLYKLKNKKIERTHYTLWYDSYFLKTLGVTPYLPSTDYKQLL